MDVQCARAFLQELKVEVGVKCVSEFRSTVMCLHGIPTQQLQSLFLASIDHFKGKSAAAELLWFGKRAVPGFWVEKPDSLEVMTFVVILQFAQPMRDLPNLNRYLSVWLKDLKLDDVTRGSIISSVRVLTTCECDHLSLRYMSPVEVDPITKGNLEQIPSVFAATNREDDLKLRRLMGEVEE